MKPGSSMATLMAWLGQAALRPQGRHKLPVKAIPVNARE
jgi:hypothetical protein